MLLRDRLDFWLGKSREVCRLGRHDSLEYFRMMALQVFAEELHRAALARCMPNEDDRFGMDQIRGYLLVVGFFLWNMIALVMGFLSMDQMMLESKWIIRLDADFVFRPAAAEIVIDVGNVMVNNHNHSPDLVCLFWFPKGPSLF